MNGYKVTIYRLSDDLNAEKECNRERSEEIYDQKVSELDLRTVIAVVNGLFPTTTK